MIRRLTLLCLLATCLGGAAAPATPAPVKPSILFLRFQSGWVHGEAFFRQYARDLVEQGYTVGAKTMEMTYSHAPADYGPADIAKYDVIVMLNVPLWDETSYEVTAAFKERWQAILDHVKAGGGLLIFPSVAGKYRATGNQLLRPLGLTFVNGMLHADPVVRATVMQIAWAYTGDITKHPVTEGVRGIWQPVANSSFVWNANTVPFRAEDPWQVLVRAAATVQVKPVTFNDPRVDQAIPAEFNTIPASPPLVAVRELGKGRLAVCGIDSHYSANGGLAPAYEGIVMGTGLDNKPSDMPRLLDNLYTWLAEPAKAAGFTGAVTDTDGLAPASFEPPPPLATPGPRFPAPKHQWRGLIGAHSNWSGGKSTPEQFVKAAQAAKLDFLVFLEDYNHIDEARFQQLQAQVQGMQGDLLVFVGLTYEDEVGDHYFAFCPNLVFPQEKWMVPGTKRFQTIFPKASGLPLNDFAQKNGSNRCFIGAWRPPNATGVPYWDTRTYRCIIPVFTSLNGQPIDSMVDEYGVVSDSAEVPRAMALTLIDDASMVADVAAGKQPLTVLLAPTLQDLWDKPGESNDFSPVAYVTQGPRIDDWQLGGPRDYVANGNWFDWTRYWWGVRLAVSAPAGIREVKIMDGTQLFRRYLPGGATSFEQSLDLTHNQQHHLFLIVTDLNGKVAVSENLIDRNHLMEFVYCTDRNNTLSYSATPAPDSPWGSTAGSWCLPTMPKGPMTDNVRLDVNMDQLRFPGFDGQASGGAWTYSRPILQTEQGSEGYSVNRQIKLPLATADVVVQEGVLDLKFKDGITIWNAWNNLGPLEPQRLFSGTVRSTTFIHPGHLPGIVLVEGDLVALQDLTFDPKVYMPLTAANASVTQGSAGYETSVILHTGEQNHVFALRYDGRPAVQSAVGPFPTGAYSWFYPSLFGAFGLFSLDDDLSYQYIGSLHRVVVGKRLPAAGLKAGQHLRYRYLSVTASYNDLPAVQTPEALRDQLGLDGTPGYKLALKQGKLIATDYMLRLDGEGKGACVTIHQPGKGLPAVLPIRVEHLNDRWTSVLYDRKTNQSRPLGMLDGAAWAHLEPSAKPADLFIGHPFTCDQPDIFLTLVQTGAKSWLLCFHNPTDQPLAVTATRDKFFGGVPAAPVRAQVPAGATVSVSLPLPKP